MAQTAFLTCNKNVVASCACLSLNVDRHLCGGMVAYLAAQDDSSAADCLGCLGFPRGCESHEIPCCHGVYMNNNVILPQMVQ